LRFVITGPETFLDFFENDSRLLHIGNQNEIRRIVGLKTIREAAASLRPGDAVVCQVEHSGRLMYVAFEIDL
jgi:hypothetical protein